MALQMRHSHIAVRKALKPLARAVGAGILDGEDDLGRYRYFDLVVSHEDQSSQRIRFASHSGDRMVHLLAERIDMVSDLAAALFAVGIRGSAALSISTDREGRPVRSVDVIEDRIAAMSVSPGSGIDSLQITAGHDGRNPTLPRVAMHRPGA